MSFPQPTLYYPMNISDVNLNSISPYSELGYSTNNTDFANIFYGQPE